MNRIVAATTAVMTAGLCLGCQQSTSAGGPAAHKLHVLLTDAPFPYDSVTRVDVYFVRVMASTQPDTGTNADDTVALGLHTIAAPHRVINVLSLAGGTLDSLGTDSVAGAATYQQLRVSIRTDSSSVTLKDGTVLTGTTSPGIAWSGPAEQTYGLFLEAPLSIPDTGATIIVDFNAGRSFQLVDTTAGDGFRFVPYIRAVNSALTGTISGNVVDSASGTPLPNVGLTVFAGDPQQSETAWGIISTSKTGVGGTFTLPFIGPGTYILGADGSPSSGYGAVRQTGVVVTTGNVTALGTLLLQAK